MDDDPNAGVRRAIKEFGDNIVVAMTLASIAQGLAVALFIQLSKT